MSYLGTTSALIKKANNNMSKVHYCQMKHFSEHQPTCRQLDSHFLEAYMPDATKRPQPGRIPTRLCPRDMKDQLPERRAYTFKKVLLGQARVQTQPPSHHRYPSVEARCDCVPEIRPFI